jgi:hypothetical protein
MNTPNKSFRDIAEAFSHGDFKSCYPYLSEQITWDVVGDEFLIGKKAVMEQCEGIAEYFKTIHTRFLTDDVIVSENKVVIRGKGEFLRDGKRLNLILACDVYEFNDQGKVELISSYCIPEKK